MENSECVTEAATLEFGAKVTCTSHVGTWHQLFLSGNGDRWHPAGVNLWLRQLGIFGQRSHQKRIPGEAFLRLVYGRLDPEHSPDVDLTGAVALDDLRGVFPGV